MNRLCGIYAAISALAFSAGCSSFSETHYFKDNASPRNYYKLRISGAAALSSSRYMSGYYDESAIDTYFGEFVQPEKGRVFPAPTPPAGGGEGDGGSDAPALVAVEDSSGVKTLTGDTNLDDRKLVLLFTTNSDAIATGIQSLAQNEAIGTALVGIINRGRISESRSAGSELVAAKVRGKMVTDDGARLVSNLPDDADQPTTEKNLLAYASVLGRYLGGPDSFKDLNEAAKWLEDNRARLERRFMEE